MRSGYIILALVLFTGMQIYLCGCNQKLNNTKQQLRQFWESRSYDNVFSLSQSALETEPLDYFLLTIHGFSAYQLGISQINKSDTMRYIDQCVLSLRKAILLKEASSDKLIWRVYYVLGKAYFEKGEDHMDLAITYLEKARELKDAVRDNPDDGKDIPEYLGLAYAASGDYRSSVEAFSQALSPLNATPSDLLLLSIARSYVELNEPETAKAYLMHCLEISKDSKTIVTVRFLLAEIYNKAGNFEGAKNQLSAIIDSMGDNSEAYYQLGELYAQRGDIAQARAQWRLSLKTDPANQKARTRLGQ